MGAVRRFASRLVSLVQTQEWSRDARTFRWLDDARRDGLYAMRMLRRRPLVAVIAVSSLAIGIGLNAAVFSVVDWVLRWT